MAKILGVYKKTRSLMEAINMAVITPEDIQYQIPQVLMTKYYLIVKDAIEREKDVALDFSAILTLTEIGKTPIVSWDALEDMLTDKIVLGYRTEFPNYTDNNRSLTAVNILNDYDFELSYGTWKSPEDRNRKISRYRLFDMIITKLDKKNPFELENCLLSVNGCISQPKMFNGELFSINGALFTHANTARKIPSICMMDFTNLGGFTIVPLAACKRRIKSGEQNQSRISPGVDIEYILPDSVDLYTSTVFPVIAHSMFFPDSISVTGKHSLVMSPYRYPLEACLLKEAAASNKYVESTSIIRTRNSINQYVTDTMHDPEHYGAFFVVVHTPQVFIKKTHATTYCYNTASALPNTDGIMFDATTQSFIDNVRIDYHSLSDFYMVKATDIWQIPTIQPVDYSVYSMETVKCVHQQFLRNLADNDVYVVQITR